jgi:hypothetical protein
MYAPSKEQAEEDRAKAYEQGIPHGADPYPNYTMMLVVQS